MNVKCARQDNEDKSFTTSTIFSKSNKTNNRQDPHFHMKCLTWALKSLELFPSTLIQLWKEFREALRRTEASSHLASDGRLTLRISKSVWSTWMWQTDRLPNLASPLPFLWALNQTDMRIAPSGVPGSTCSSVPTIPAGEASQSRARD